MFLDSIIFKKSKNGDNKVVPRSEIGNLELGPQGGFLMGHPGGDDRCVFITILDVETHVIGRSPCC